jgi:hypothetical protein
MLLIHGEKDQTVGIDNAKRLAAKIMGKGGIVKTAYYPDRGHVAVVQSLAWPFRWLAPTLRDVTAFFRSLD